MNNHLPEPDDDHRGLKCRACGCKQFRVIYTRPYRGGGLVRRRECRHCGRRMTTLERVVGEPAPQRRLAGPIDGR